MSAFREAVLVMNGLQFEVSFSDSEGVTIIACPVCERPDTVPEPRAKRRKARLVDFSSRRWRTRAGHTVTRVLPPGGDDGTERPEAA